MSVRRAWHRVANETQEVARNLRRADKAAEKLEQRGTAAGGGGNAGGLSPQFLASGVAPAGGGATPGAGGKGAKLGSGGGSGVEGVSSGPTNFGTLAAIIEASGVAAPPRNEWPPNGLTNAPPGFIVATVLANGTKAPVNFLIWCAGLLAYTQTEDLGATAGRHGGGFNGNPMSGKRDPRFGDYNFAGPSRIGWTQRNAGWGNPGYVGDVRPNYTGQAQGSPTSQGISSSQASSLVSSTKESNTLLSQVVGQLSQLNANLANQSGGVETRARR